ncbi:MAG: hypothetical protein J6K22_02805 [Spirochaetaceae bacterium]|nr:hypothetical protein [Spirochaetaceae bacterium]
MSIKNITITNVRIVDNKEKQKIITFFDDIITKWLTDRNNEWFCINDLLDFGIEQHKDWNGTPLQVLRDNYINSGKTEEQAHTQAGKDAGKLLKETVHLRQENFDTKKNYYRYYKKI